MADDKKATATAATPPTNKPPTETTAGTPDDKGPPPDPNEGPGKGKAFFDRAKTVAATSNYDYAIEMYIQGLNREPFNVPEHQALRTVAMHRKVNGGKAGGGLFGGPKMPFKGKTPKEALLNNEFTLARDVGNITAMMAMLRNADLLKLKDLILWTGSLLKEANRTNKTPKVEIYVELAATYARYGEFGRACDVINDAAKLKPEDGELNSLVNEYAAQATIQKGKYDEEGDFKKSIKDVEKTNERLQEENLAKSQEYLLKMLAIAKAEFDANPKELQVITKYSKALIEMDDEEHENEAIDILKKAYADTSIYRLKYAAGDVRIKQFRRNLRVIREAVKADPKDKEMIQQYEALNKERLGFELSEFHERCEHMPTDMLMKYEYGTRLWEAKRYDEAIVALQEAQQNPKHRVDALHLLGRAFLQQSMAPEAVDTAKRSIEEYDLAASGDRKSKELHYWYGRALETNKQTKEAIDIYSKVIRWDIAFLDARKRLNELRAQLEGTPPV